MKAIQPKRTNGRKPFEPKNVLVIRKTTCLMEMTARNDHEALRLVEEGHSSVAGVKETHEESERCADEVEAALAAARIPFRSIYRHEAGVAYNKADLVITVGGDGSFIDAAHNIKSGIPLLGVKSAATSHGHFCLANEVTFPDVLQQILSGKLRPRELVRLVMLVDGKQLPLYVVNEVLIAELDISGTNKYQVTVGGRTEKQKGSGLVVCTPAGSTGLMRSMKGIIQPILGKRFQYKPLLPFLQPREKQMLPGGLLPARAEVRVISGMPKMLLHIDGRHIKFPFPLGAQLVVRVAADQPLTAYVSPRCHDWYMGKGEPPGS